MSSVDDRIVNMKFNNSQFSQGVDQTKRDLTGLEKSITNAGKSKGMTQLGAAADGVKVKFSALQVAGTAALATIAAKATAAGLKFLKSFTIQPLIDGFREYQTNLQSTQTIQANTGASLKEVNKTLDLLNDYADQTIYNFSQMAKNIGTFTAAGVELDRATSAIKGISNLAALSGSSAEQASRAMYQLSQAIAAGRMNLQDWNSVVNAGMGGKQFKAALARTAVAMGDLSAGAVKVGTDVEIMGQSFRNSISAAAGQEAWLSSDVLVTTLAMLDGRLSTTRMKVEGLNSAEERNNKIREERAKLVKQGLVFSDKEWKAMVKMADASYAAATEIKTFPQLIDVMKESVGSMWAGAFRIVLGDLKQSKKLWGAVGETIVGPKGIISKMSGGLLGMLKDWVDGGGRKYLIEGFGNIGKTVLNFILTIKRAFQDIFPPGGGQILIDISKAFARITDALKPSWRTFRDLRSIFGAVFSVLHLGLTIVRGIASAFGSFFSALNSGTKGSRRGIISMVAQVAEGIIAFEKWLTSGGKIQEFFAGFGTVVGAALRPVLSTISLVVRGIASIFTGGGLGGARNAFKEAKDAFNDFLGDMLHGLDQLTAPFDPLKAKIGELGSAIGEKLSGPFWAVVEFLDRIRMKVIEGLGLDKVLPTLDGFKTWVSDMSSRFVDFINGLADINFNLQWFGEGLDKARDKLKDFADNIDISDKIQKVKDAISDLFGGASSGASAGVAAGSGAMIATAETTGSAFSKLGDIFSSIGGAIKAVFGGIGDAIGWIVDKISNIPFPDDAIEWAQVLNFIIAGGLLKKFLFGKGVFEQLASSIEEVGTAIKRGATNSLKQLTSTLETMQNAVKSEMIKNIAIAVAILVASLIALSFIPTDKLANGLGALAATMMMAGLLMQIMLRSMGDFKVTEMVQKGTAILSIGTAMVLMATSIAILAGAVALLAMIPLDKLAKGLGAVAILMGIMTASMLALSRFSKNNVAVAASLLAMALAISMLAVSVSLLGQLNLSTLAKGLGSVALMVALMTASLVILSKNSKNVVTGAGAMLAMAASITIMSAAVALLGQMDLGTLAKGLGSMALMIAMLTVSLIVLSKSGGQVALAGLAILMVASALVSLAAVVAFLGALPIEVIAKGLGALAFGLGILLLAALGAQFVLPGLGALALIIRVMGVAALMAGAGMFLFATGLSILVAVGVAAIGIMVLAIQAFIALLPTIALQMAAAFVGFIQAIAAASPKIRKAFVTIGRNIIGTITDLVPEIGKLFDTIVATAITSIENGVPRFIEMGYTVIDEFLKSVDEHIPSIADSAVSIIETFMREVGENTARLAKTAQEVIITFCNDMSEVIENSDEVRDAAWKLVTTFADEVREGFADVLSKINPATYLPAVDFNALAQSILPKTDMRGKGGKYDALFASIEKTAGEVLTAVNAAITIVSGAFRELAIAAQDAQRSATKQATKADIYQAQADIAVDAADSQMSDAQGMKRGKKGSPQAERRAKAIAKAKTAMTKARRQQRAAEREANAATMAQLAADAKAQEARDKQAYKDDAAGYGDASSQRALDLATRADELSASASAKAAEIARLEREANKTLNDKKASKAEKELARQYKKQAAQLRREAAQETAEASALAAQSISAQAEAVKAYEQARREAAQNVIERMGDIKKQQAAEKEARDWQARYDAAEKTSNDPTKETKQKMLNDRIAKNTKDLETANSTLAAAYAESDRIQAQIAATGQVSPEELANLETKLAEAEAAAQTARDAQQAIEQDQQTLKQLAEEIQQDRASGGTGNGGVSVTPSRTALEDAALAVDRYSASVAQAEEMAAAGASTQQFIQNNYSPEALSASQIYRQTNNLLSAAEIKMGV